MYVSQNGYKKINSFIGKNDIKNILPLLKADHKITQLNKKTVIAKLGSVYSKVEDLIENQPDYSVKFSKLWLVHSQHSNSDNTKLPYLPHFDRLRFLKVMIYLTDTNVENGAFYACRRNVHDTECKRRALPFNHKEAFMNDASKLGEFEPIVGKAGDAIIFDTNCPHYAGSIVEGAERKVARFDYANIQWNSYWENSFGQKLKRSLIAYNH
jgi:hypothetical protein